MYVHLCFCAAMNVERIIECIREGDQKGLKAELQQFNREVLTINSDYIQSSGSKTNVLITFVLTMHVIIK